MKTIVEPNEQVDKLWGKQRIKDETTYRMMRYVLHVEHDGKVLLHNIVTGRLVILDQEEAEAVDRLPLKYEPAMENLIQEHYLVPSEFNERQQVVNLRKVLLKLRDDLIPDDIFAYTILPTTGCNARCYYCFEQGAKVMTMTRETADEVVQFISSRCGPKKEVSIMWFGGEPTVAANRISQICEGLLKNGINYRSSIITNGYLMDALMVKTAWDLWHLRSVQICVDGVGETYNRIKAYVNPKTDPYETVMSNIGYMLNAGIKVTFRVNFDLNNVDEFEPLLQEVRRRYGKDSGLSVISHPVIGEHRPPDGNILHGSKEWFDKTQADLNQMSMQYGLFRTKVPFPCLNLHTCAGYNKNAVSITPDGRLVKCSEQFGVDQTIGDIRTGIENDELVDAWKEIADYDSCASCMFYPHCLKLVQCSAKDSCMRFSYLRSITERQIKGKYDQTTQKE